MTQLSRNDTYLHSTVTSLSISAQTPCPRCSWLSLPLPTELREIRLSPGELGDIFSRVLRYPRPRSLSAGEIPTRVD